MKFDRQLQKQVQLTVGIWKNYVRTLPAQFQRNSLQVCFTRSLQDELTNLRI